MDLGLLIPPVADSWKTIKRAEELGFTRAWFYDTQMLNTEVFVAMTAAALHTSRIRLATGVLIPSNRIAPVAASGLASLNALAPGRIDFGISTGFTARRTLGLGAVRQRDLEEYIRVVQGLLEGETVNWGDAGEVRKIRFLDADIGAINIKDRIPLHIAATGGRGRRLVARLGAGWLASVAGVPYGQASIADMQTAWREAGRDSAALYASAAISGCVLRPGEAYDSPRVKAETGAHATMILHAMIEQGEYGAPPRQPLPAHLQPILERYREMYQHYVPEDARYLSNHRGHLMYLRPEEHELCTAELIRATTWTAPPEELRERLQQLTAAGYSHIAINFGLGTFERLEQWAELFSSV
ncbi:MAG: LLM class flavin-dependent oxidoreductase [Chloroflexi bacterium]|nr:LLM class flavin-dependent oxidoreductase [Chloroflexota bacterium]MBV9601488.1 LLM class flavin-dependent oxidoreductase [Chloroflexota bacterium]